jgi:hypothetical protein
MSMINRLQRLYWVYFSKPKSSRILYRAIRDLRATKIVEFGIADPERSLQLIKMAVGMHQGTAQVSYTAIDLFDARPQMQSPLSVKQAHCFFASSGAKVQLVPGSMREGLARTANTLLGTDLVIFAEEAAPVSDSRLWFYLPRLLHSESRILQAHAGTEDTEPMFCKLSRAEIEQRVASHTRRCVA